jgi:signal transduction histidine kinase/CheY-like chemotaxis protein
MGLSAELFGQLDAVGEWGLLATDTDLTVTRWNRWLERWTGRAAADAVGRHLFDLFPDLVARGLDRHYRQALSGQTAILSQRFHKFVLALPRAAGEGGAERMHQSGRIVPLLDDTTVTGTLTVIEDVTERVIREAELQSRTRRQAALALSARSALAGDDVVDLCREVVGHLAETLGVEFAEALEFQPTGVWTRLAGAGWPEPSEHVFEPARASRTDAVVRSATPVAFGAVGGDPLAADAGLRASGVAGGLVVRIPGRGRPFGLLGAYTRALRRFSPDELQFAQALADIIGTAAERKHLEAELRLRAKELATADRRKDEFLAMLAHELRNPLAPLRNAVQILRLTGTREPEVVRLADLMGRQVGQMAHMVDDLLDVSRITHGKVELRKEPVTLADAVARAVETARPLIDARRHELIVSCSPEPVVLDADPMRLTQVLGNLLNNAAKYTAEGGRIWVAAGREGGEAVVRVRDTGIGLAPEMLTSVFDLFTQENRTLDREQGGLGIGLTLVRSLVELHGGTVRAASEGPGRGSEFVVRLPALTGGASASDASNRPRPTAPPRRRLLIVDDNVDSAESLAELLALTGHDVRTAHDGAAGLTAAESFRPEVVLLDIGLPRVNGYEVARRIRDTPALRGALLIAMTGYGQEEARHLSKEAGFDHHLVKPVDLSELNRLLASRPS